MFKVVKTDVDWWRITEQKFGHNPEKWPKGVSAEISDRVNGIGGMFYTSTLAEDGKGPIRAEMTRKVVYISNGRVMTWCEVTGRRANNTGEHVSITTKFTFKNVHGRWLIDGVSRDQV
jgi:hypothetical protein